MASSSNDAGLPKPPREPTWPTHNAPRVWFLTCATSPIGVCLCRLLLQHGDYVTAGVLPREFEQEPERSQDFREFLEEISSAGHDNGSKEASWKQRLRVVALDVRVMGQCQSAVAEAIASFGRIDVLFCCHSEVVVGTVEELCQSPRAQSLVTDQFETNFFGPTNIIKSTLPHLRANKNGHIILLTAITGHLGTPGLGMFCASQWAIEGWCDALMYEIAPFNIRLTIVQPNMEVNVLTHKISSAPPMNAYSSEENPAPLIRNIFSSLLDEIEGTEEPTLGDQLYRNEVTSLYPPLSKSVKERLVMETVHAVCAIGGHDNPPARHIVGFEGTTTVKEKLKTVSEELEEFVESSAAVDFERREFGSPQQAKADVNG
ncbi:NAD(P)-binding protein [Polychaeton citri CBS 116435]|uniref:NAD(P)-binding protein n=1 Tax=Polychaeton citri CBS 116435 TaxID=1314669 RepID=A0A9P4UPT5_9PEZI|nr:NAD(P)-binding protein [Polychaeton citri CBS 116435]